MISLPVTHLVVKVNIFEDKFVELSRCSLIKMLWKKKHMASKMRVAWIRSGTFHWGTEFLPMASLNNNNRKIEHFYHE